MLAPKFNLNNLITFIDYNGAQSDGLVSDLLDLEPLKQKITSFNWNVLSISGHNLQEIENSANTEIVSTRSGGATGGKSKLTESGRELINKFNQISDKVMESDGEIFEPKSE